MAGSNAGCTATAEETWAIDDNGVVALSGDAASLVGRPSGVADRCEYEAGFQTSVSNDAGTLALTSDATVAISAESVSAAAEYMVPFVSNVVITVPNRVSNGVNVFWGFTFSVDFSPVADSHEGCTSRFSGLGG